MCENLTGYTSVFDWGAITRFQGKVSWHLEGSKLE